MRSISLQRKKGGHVRIQTRLRLSCKIHRTANGNTQRAFTAHQVPVEYGIGDTLKYMEKEKGWKKMFKMTSKTCADVKRSLEKKTPKT